MHHTQSPILPRQYHREHGVLPTIHWYLFKCLSPVFSSLNQASQSSKKRTKVIERDTVITDTITHTQKKSPVFKVDEVNQPRYHSSNTSIANFTSVQTKEIDISFLQTIVDLIRRQTNHRIEGSQFYGSNILDFSTNKWNIDLKGGDQGPFVRYY